MSGRRAKVQHEWACVDGVSGGKNISNAFASKFQNVLNVNPGSSFSPHVTDSLLGDVYFSDDDVLEAILQLKPHKYDSCGISTEHLKFASSVICQPLSAFLTSAVRHGYMPSCIRDSVMSSLLKGNKNPLCSDSYRPIALASCISKVLEILIIHKYSSFLQSSHLQFGPTVGNGKKSGRLLVHIVIDILLFCCAPTLVCVIIIIIIIIIVIERNAITC